MLPMIFPLFVLLAVWPLSGEDPLETSFPMEAIGNIRFQADVVLFEDDGQIAPEVILAIPQDALRADDETDSLRVRVTVEMLDRSGDSRVQYQTEVPLDPDTTAGSRSSFPVPERWLRLHPRWFEGTEGMRIRVEDVTRLKIGLLDKLRGEHPEGTAQGRLTWPTLRDSTGLMTSGLLFAWAQAEGGAGAGPGFRSVRARLHPNPFRFFGLFQPVVTVYWERYGLPRGVPEGAPVTIVYEISPFDSDVVIVKTKDLSTASATPRWELQRFDVSRLASGDYRLEVRIEDEGGTTLARSDGRFQVLWEERRWTEDEETLLSYAELLLTPADYDSLLLLDRGGQEEFLRRFWNRRSPTSAGEPNRLEREFLRRIAHVNEQYGSRFREGFETDRGRVYVRLGEPDEVTFNVNPQDRETLAYVLPEEIDDPSEDLATRLRQTKRRSIRDNSAYEVWEYTLQGEPLIPEYTGMKKGLKFIFVDELGYGEYRLVYTNVPGGLY